MIFASPAAIFSIPLEYGTPQFSVRRGKAAKNTTLDKISD
jgi:hypothetical protein